MTDGTGTPLLPYSASTPCLESPQAGQWLKVISTFQEAWDEIRGQLACPGQHPLTSNNENAFFKIN